MCFALKFSMKTITLFENTDSLNFFCLVFMILKFIFPASLHWWRYLLQCWIEIVRADVLVIFVILGKNSLLLLRMICTLLLLSMTCTYRVLMNVLYRIEEIPFCSYSLRVFIIYYEWVFNFITHLVYGNDHMTFLFILLIQLIALIGFQIQPCIPVINPI